MIIILKNIKQLVLIIALFYSPNVLTAQPLKKDYTRTAIELTLLVSLEYNVFNLNSFKDKKVVAPNKFDNYLRNKLIWDLSDLDRAKLYSDILLYGIVLGSIPTSPLLLKNHDYKALVLTNLEVLAINGLLTDITKYIVGRQRPSSYFGTRDEKKDAFKSFFSGHTSSAFAVGTSTAMMLSNEYPHKRGLIWISTYTIATLTGYYRIAADKHYTSDVFMGAIIGSAVGYLTQKSISKSYFSLKVEKTSFLSKGLNLSLNF
jgi:membrane-associated phospholipid phosphatase